MEGGAGVGTMQLASGTAAAHGVGAGASSACAGSGRSGRRRACKVVDSRLRATGGAQCRQLVRARAEVDEDRSRGDEAARTSAGGVSRRRGVLGAAVASAASALSALGLPLKAARASVPPVPDSERYPLWWVVPLAPYGRRKTAMSEAVPGRVWMFEQMLGTLNVLVNVRTTVVKLDSGGLWVHSPVAPTAEFLGQVRGLEAQHGPVRYVVLSSSAVEHKSTFGPFAKAFPAAELWTTEGQWSWPWSLPLPLLGLWPRRVDGLLPASSRELLPGEKRQVPWASQIEHEVLSVSGAQIRGFGRPWFLDCAFYDKASGTLVVTDVVASAGKEPPPVISDEALSIRAMDRWGQEEPVGTPATRAKGWGKIVLFGLLFKPASVDFAPRPGFPLTLGQDLRDGFTWDPSWEPAFERLAARTLFVPPILEVLAFPRRREYVYDWSRRVARWDFKRVIPGHLKAPVAAGPKDLTDAIDVALDAGGVRSYGADANLLVGIEKVLTNVGALQQPGLQQILQGGVKIIP